MKNDFRHLTAKETTAVARLLRAFQTLPPTLVLCVVDTSVVICKKELPLSEFSLTIHNKILNPCAVLTDAHDNCDNGNS